MRLRRPGLIIHTFLAGDADLRPIWDAVAALGMDQPIGRWPVKPGDADRSCADQRFVVVAGRQQLRPGAFHQAIAYRVHDVLGISVLLAPNDDQVGWDRLNQRWTEQVREPPPGTLGTVVLHTGVLSLPRRWHGGRTDPARIPPERLAVRLGANLPDPAAEWASAWCRTNRGLVAWELPGDETLTHRRLVTVTAADNEPALDDWTWAGEGAGLPPLTRYLLHAAKLRYQHRVLESGMPALRAAVARVEDGCAVLDELLGTEEPPLAQLLAADRALSAAQIDQSGLIAALGDVRDMTRTVQVAERNMAAALSAAIRSAPTGPSALDRELAGWLGEQLRTEETYLNSAHRRVREVGRLAGTVIDQRQRQRQESLTLLQTSILGALLMVLAAIQSLTYKTPLPGPLLSPVICVLGTIALLLPAALLRQSGGAAKPRFRWVVVAAGSLVGATLGWLGATLGWVLATGHGAPPGWSATTSGGAFVLLAVVVGLVGRSR